MLIPLKTLMREFEEDESGLQSVLSSFSCPLDPDIQHFLHRTAVKFEMLSKSRTYLLFDEDAMAEGRLFILGYFLLALKVLKIPGGLNTNQRKKLDGYSANFHGQKITEIVCYLIGQLARNADSPKECLSGAKLIDYAQGIILNANEAVGGRYMMIECKDDEKLKRFYQRNGFQEFQIDDFDHAVQMICKIA